MVKRESHKKFLLSNRSKQGHILLVVMSMAVLTSCWLLCYQNQVYLLNNTLRNTKKALKEKQAFHLACFAFHQLKTIASDDFVATCNKKGKLRFYNVQTEYPKNLGPIELYLDNHKMGTRVFPNEKIESTINCLYQSNGLRKPIQETCCNNLNKDSWNLIKQRWNALQTEDFIPSTLFFPLVKQLDLKNESLSVTFYNPFNKSIRGPTNIEIQGYPRETLNADVSVLEIIHQKFSSHDIIDIAPQKIFSKNIPLPESFCMYEVKLGNLTFTFERVSTKGHYSVAYSNLYEPFSYTLNSLSLYRKPGLWGRKSGSPSKNFSQTTSPLPSFKTKNWIQQLNACCFFAETGKPYCLLNHFDLEANDRIALRDFFWNTIAVNPQSEPFNFNGSELYLKNKLNAINFFTDDKEEQTTINAILSHQPYPHAIAFLKQIKKFHKKMHLFANLKHRTETFDIEAFCENIKCRMTVCRVATDVQQRTWKIQNIKIITEKNPFF